MLETVKENINTVQLNRLTKFGEQTADCGVNFLVCDFAGSVILQLSGNKFHSRRRDMLICSKECGRNIRLQSYIKKIEKKITDGLPFSARTAKRYLLATAGNKCSICEIRKWLDKSVGLIIDHINGDSNDNTIKNLRLVCGNCDMQLPTYKGRNAGNGRFSRRKRYAEGKSY